MIQAILKLADRNEKLPPWAGKPLARTKFDRDSKELPRYARIEAKFRAQAQGHVRRFISGEIDRRTLLKEFRKDLYRAETEAFIAGKRSSGKPVYFVTPGEQKMLTGRHSRNMKYFNKFVRDMEAGKGRMDYGYRAGMYAESLWSIYNRGQSGNDWDTELKPNAVYEWVMDPDAEHCPGCLERWMLSRAKGGFTWDELVEIGFPGEGTECMTRCRCHIREKRRRTVTEGRIDQASAQEAAEDGMKLLESILGGSNLPLKIPAAGLPPVKIEPAVVARSIATAGEARDELAKTIPTALAALVKPDDLYEGNDRRTYVKGNIGVELSRDPNSGQWSVSMIFMLENGMPVASNFEVPWTR